MAIIMDKNRLISIDNPTEAQIKQKEAILPSALAILTAGGIGFALAASNFNTEDVLTKPIVTEETDNTLAVNTTNTVVNEDYTNNFVSTAKEEKLMMEANQSSDITDLSTPDIERSK